MTKRKVTQLFAAVALAASAPIATAQPARPTANQAEQPRTLPSGAPACGNVQIKGSRVRRCTATAPAPKPEPATPAPTTTAARNANPQPPSMLQKLLSIVGARTPVARPRELRDGSPANGNVARRTSARDVERPIERPTNPNNSN